MKTEIRLKPEVGAVNVDGVRSLYAQVEPTNDRQLDVLRLISSGDDVETGSKTSARALHSRGLVVISTRGGWTAEITEAGRFYLRHGHHPLLTAVAQRSRPWRDGAATTPSSARYAVVSGRLDDKTHARSTLRHLPLAGLGEDEQEDAVASNCRGHHPRAWWSWLAGTRTIKVSAALSLDPPTILWPDAGGDGRSAV